MSTERRENFVGLVGIVVMIISIFIFYYPEAQAARVAINESSSTTIELENGGWVARPPDPLVVYVTQTTGETLLHYVAPTIGGGGIMFGGYLLVLSLLKFTRRFLRAR